MQAERILNYLSEIARNNNREWFYANKKEYDAVRKDFEADIINAISRIASFDASVAHLGIKDVTYRFNRDTRFSPDKSPYKRHFALISPPTARNRFMEATTSILNQAIACCVWALIGFLLTFSMPAGMKS